MRIAKINTVDYTQKSALNFDKRQFSTLNYEISDVYFKGKKTPSEKIDGIISEADRIADKSIEYTDRLPVLETLAQKYIEDAQKTAEMAKSTGLRYSHIHCLDGCVIRLSRDKDNENEVQLTRYDECGDEQVVHLSTKEIPYKIYAADVRQGADKYIRVASNNNSKIIVNYRKSNDTFIVPKLIDGAKFMKNGNSIRFSKPEISIHNNSITHADEIYVTDENGNLTAGIKGFKTTTGKIPTEYSADSIFVYDNKGLKKAYKGVKGKMTELTAKEAYSRNFFGKIVRDDKIQAKDLKFLQDISSFEVDELLSRLQ